MLRRNGKSSCPVDVLGETVSSRCWGKYSTQLFDISSNETKLICWKRLFTDKKKRLSVRFATEAHHLWLQPSNFQWPFSNPGVYQQVISHFKKMLSSLSKNCFCEMNCSQSHLQPPLRWEIQVLFHSQL